MSSRMMNPSEMSWIHAVGLARRILALGVVVALVLGGYVWFHSGPKLRTVSAHFGQAISVYPGTSVSVMGIPIGHVTAVVPEGSTVRVDMAYDPKYQLPADVQAAIVTPALVSDRFIQLSATTDDWCWECGGHSTALADAGDIPAARSHEPIEIDQVYASLSQLTRTLGPNGANKAGALNELLTASAKALKGNGALGNETLKNLSGALQVLGDNAPALFQTVDGLSQLSQTLQTNDALVDGFLSRLANVSSQLGDESDDLQKALASIADALGTVQSFIHDNRAMLTTDLQQLTNTVHVLANQKDTLGKILQMAPMGLNNLTEAYDSETGTVGIRVQLGPVATDLGNVLCGVLTVNHMPNVQQACTLLRALLPGATNVGAGVAPTSGGGVPVAPPGGLAGILDPVVKGLL